MGGGYAVRVTDEPEAELARAIDEVYAQDLKRTSRRVITWEILKQLLYLVPMFGGGSLFGLGLQYQKPWICFWAGLICIAAVIRFWADTYKSRGP